MSFFKVHEHKQINGENIQLQNVSKSMWTESIYTYMREHTFTNFVQLFPQIYNSFTQLSVSCFYLFTIFCLLLQSFSLIYNCLLIFFSCFHRFTIYLLSYLLVVSICLQCVCLLFKLFPLVLQVFCLLCKSFPFVHACLKNFKNLNQLTLIMS